MTDIHARISQISAQLAALSAGSPPTRTAGGATSTAGTSTTGSSTGAGSSAGSAGSFDAVLASALSDGPTPASSAAASAGVAPPTASGNATDPSSSAALVAARMALTGLPTASTATAAAPAASATAPTTAPAAGPAPAAPKPVAASYPTDLSAYGNGRIPTTALKPLGVGDHRLWAPAADNFRAMKAAAARDGVSLGVNDSYRSYAEQVDMARRKGLYSQGGLAAAPGTSEHGLGKSVDLQLDGRALTWMRAHADEYGFSNNVPRESWHWTYTRRS